MRKSAKSCIALLLALLLVLLSVPFASVSAAGDPEILIGVLSDVHIFPKELTGNFCDAFRQENTNDGKITEQTEGLLISSLAAMTEHAKTNGMKYLLISGDLTRNGEYDGHVRLAQYLLEFEQNTGVQVAVIPGNHDVYNHGAKTYADGTSQDARYITPADFREIYADLGYDLADAFYTPPAGEEGGGLSYAADLDGFRLIAIDSCKYSPDYVGGEGTLTGGMIGEGAMAWILDQCAQANAAGKPVIGMLHHNLTEHIGLEESMFLDYMLDDYRVVRETLADAGMHFTLSGHIHVEEIGKAVSDSGEALYDICMAALQSFPCTFREIKFSEQAGKIMADVHTYQPDEVLPVTAGGVTYPQPFTKSAFNLTYGTADGRGLSAFVALSIERMLHGQLENIQRAGGISAFLKASGTDIEQSLADALGGSLALGSWNIFSAKNLTGLIDDLLAQVDTIYINDDAHLNAVIEGVIDRVFALPVSKLPCTRFIDSLGFGDPGKPGTFEDFGCSALAYIYGHVDDYTTDAFFMDVISRVQSGALLDQVLDLVVSILIEDVIADELLPALKFNAQSIFVNQLSKDTVGCLLNVLLDALRGTVSRSYVAGLLKTLGVKGLVGVAQPVVGLALPADIKDALNGSLNKVIYEMLMAHDPTGNRNAVLVYDGPEAVEIGTNRDFRAPFDVSAVRSVDGTSAVITWFTKRSVTGSDVLVATGLSEGGLKQPLATGLKITAETEETTCTVNALDLGVAVILGEELQATRHTVTIEGLTSGQQYYASVGDAARDWVSAPQNLGYGADTEEPTFWQKALAFLQTAYNWIVSALTDLFRW
ncbi:MAG: metallophosphoesterase [Oscillospiraceae bacterium]|nr:metallophosphoesterase [Oscillospiraceae bacterium]